jgi:uncharacterized protein (DUF2344 family)
VPRRLTEARIIEVIRRPLVRPRIDSIRSIGISSRKILACRSALFEKTKVSECYYMLHEYIRKEQILTTSQETYTMLKSTSFYIICSIARTSIIPRQSSSIMLIPEEIMRRQQRALEVGV